MLVHVYLHIYIHTLVSTGVWIYDMFLYYVWNISFVAYIHQDRCLDILYMYIQCLEGVQTVGHKTAKWKS